MSHRRTLSSHQVDLLRWIGDGCPPPAPGGGGVAYRISAAALHRRGLVRVTGRGPAWNASLAPKGREYLDQVDGDDPPDARQANHSVTQQLVDDVIAAGGSCRFPQQRWHARGSVDFERRARLAEVYGKVPAEKRLVVRRVSNDEIEVVLEEAPGYVSGRLEVTPVRVPTRVGRYHAAARWFRERTERHEVSRSQLARATRLIHAIAMEADRRGWQPGSPVPSRNGYGRQTWTATKDGHLRVSAGAEHFWFRLKEEGVHMRGPWEDDVRRYRGTSADSWWHRDRPIPRGAYDAAGNGKLQIELHTDRAWIAHGRQRHWSDRASWTLEERIPDLFRELAERVEEGRRHDEEKRIANQGAAEEARRVAEERQRRWQIAMERARDALIESDRAMALQRQAEAWHTATLLRRYCDAVQANYGDRAETVDWLRWARSYITTIDPLREPPRTPDPPDPTPEALAPHLPKGFSANGPPVSTYSPRGRWPALDGD